MSKDHVHVSAEIGQAHDGSLGTVHAYIDSLAKIGVDSVKFQMHIAEAESSEHEPFRIRFSRQDNTRYGYWERTSFSFDQWAGIKEHCEDAGLEFLASPFSVRAAQWLESLEVERYKVASGEVENNLLLDFLGRTGKPLIISTGMSSYEDIEKTLEVVEPYNCPITLMQCTTSYPVPPEQVGLQAIPELVRRFGLPVGLSDHSGTIYPSLAAIPLGASAIECHVVFDKRCFGPDTSSSVTLDEMASLIQGVRYIETALSSAVNKGGRDYVELKTIFGKSLAVNRTMQSGEIISQEDLESKKPFGKGVPASDYKKIVGRKLAVGLKAWSFVREEDLA